MTLDDLIATVQHAQLNERNRYEMAVAGLNHPTKDAVGVGIAAIVELKLVSEAIIDLLGEAQPCGFEAPETVDGDKGRYIVLDTGRGRQNIQTMTPSEVRAYCAMLLRAADEAESP